MQAEIITIGDELLIGQVVDTNSAFMAQRLNRLGIKLKQISSVHDDEKHITKAIDEAFERADIVLATGGLGPTKDDITKLTLCRYFNTCLVPDNNVKQHILSLYSERPDVLNRLTETQWQVPQSAEILENRVGSAPIMAFVIQRNNKTQWLISMPGVPYEMEIAMTEQVEPYLLRQLNSIGLTTGNIIHKTALVSGIPESSLAIVLEQFEDNLPQNLHLAYLPKDGTIRLRLSGYDIDETIVETKFRELCNLVKEWLVLREDKPLEVAVGEKLKSLGLTISTAESCTGGRLAALLNAHSGSSAFYKGSVVAYDNNVKHNLLGVSEETLNTVGAVSEQTVRQMAEGVRRLLGTDYAIATSGIAGPTGGTADKPIGTVWMAWATPEQTYAECFHLGKLRDQITARACTRALIKLCKILHI